tara:strand:+ start:79 stop:447 length:369 start_codon:yes stop_codon:yes gene_type:complete
MGYTNYWRQSTDFSEQEWDLILAFYRGLKHTFNFKDETYRGDAIQFNGLDFENHETFVLKRYATFVLPKNYEGCDPTFNFCKTNKKPYDAVVWSLLCFARYIKEDKDTFKISNDDGEHYGKE